MGEICKIQLPSGRFAYGVRIGTGYIGSQHNDLFVLFFFLRDGDEEGFQRVFTFDNRWHGEREAGYFPLNKGNIRAVSHDCVCKTIAVVDEHTLMDIRKDVFESSFCGLLENFINQKEKQHNDFFSTFTDPEGKSVYGGKFRRL